MPYMVVAVIPPHDVPPRVDPHRVRRNESRYVDGFECAFTQQKTVLFGTVHVSTDNIPSWIDPHGYRLFGARYIDGVKCTVTQQKTVYTEAKNGLPHDF